MENKFDNRFRKAQESMTHHLTRDELAEVVRIAINIDRVSNAIPWYEKRSFMRRAFRNIIRYSYSYMRVADGSKEWADYTEFELDKFAIEAGFHQYQNGNIVSIFSRIEQTESVK